MSTSEVHGRLDSDDGEGTGLVGLVEAACTGRPEAWRELVERLTPVLTATARGYRLGPQDVADVVQTTWLACIEKLHQLREPASLPGWLVTTCRRECLRLLHRQARSVAVPHDELRGTPMWSSPTADADPLEQVLRGERDSMVRLAVAALPTRQSRLLTEVLDGDGDREAVAYSRLSTALDMPVGSIGPTRQRALSRLRQDARLGLAG
jgi:RNA polymerase sigma factor (sigma-70 family)